MDERLKLEIATIEIWHIVAIVISLTAFMCLYYKGKRTASLKAFFYVQFTMILWMIAKILKTVSPTVEIRWSFIVLQYLAICLLEVAFLEFGYAYYKGKPISRKIKRLLYVFPIVQFCIVATNPCHYMFYSKYNFRGDSFGSLFYLNYFIEYIYIITGGIFCGIKFNKHFKDKNKAFLYIISIGILAPIMLNLIYVSRVLESFFKLLKLPVVFDITPIVFTWSLLIFVYATFNNEFFDLSPIMKHKIIYKLDTPICIVDSASDIIFANEQLKNNIGLEGIKTIIEKLKDKRKFFIASENNVEVTCTLEYGDSFYRIYLKPIRNISGLQYVITLNDITAYILIEKKLMDKNEELLISNKKLEEQINILKQTSHIGARNFVARELHDIIGHSLVVTIKLLEVVKLFYKKDKNMTIDTIEKAKNSISTGLIEIKEINIAKAKNRDYTGILLERELNKILDKVEVAGLSTKFYFKGTINEMDEKIFDVVKKVCTELITNTLKHAKASKLLLSLIVKNDKLNIYFMDDGAGSLKIIKGNGLLGIESRLKIVGGSVEFNSIVNEGFCANIIIPNVKKIMTTRQACK
ncbi:sensor histidine kinase [Clostridium sp. DL1XJH146]